MGKVRINAVIHVPETDTDLDHATGLNHNAQVQLTSVVTSSLVGYNVEFVEFTREDDAK